MTSPAKSATTFPRLRRIELAAQRPDQRPKGERHVALLREPVVHLVVVEDVDRVRLWLVGQNVGELRDERAVVARPSVPDPVNEKQRAVGRPLERLRR